MGFDRGGRGGRGAAARGGRGGARGGRGGGKSRCSAAFDAKLDSPVPGFRVLAVVTSGKAMRVALSAASLGHRRLALSALLHQKAMYPLTRLL